MTDIEIGNHLEKLTENSERQFGIMTPQHMLEHLIITFKLSTGKIKIPEFVPSEKQLGYKEMLLNTDMVFPRGVRAPGLPDDLLPLRFDSIHIAKSKFKDAVEEFHTFFQANPTESTFHPRFAKLNYEEWQKFHDKHVTHHLSQFS